MKLMANSLIRRRGRPDVPPGSIFEVLEPEAVEKMLAVGYAIPPKESPGLKADAFPPPDKSMSLAALKDLAAQHGLDASKSRTKDEVIAMIHSKLEGDAQ